ncbi:hypothetical protein [Vibrio gazogenes]|uniref:Uncharacterized protein n=1 Tax=Vibrio gazogenes DSM 21264 = NBRC 103151 TaxID=1123492 RepID=A0A1M5FY06_VIBGA|nr:hypothetical protein [Vibrio gazogenes]USP14693.1 hypothetical protein MKS89_05090 [Vibrio gazogenes]SHF96343.1 hypothetical protein SAMN02745781_03615 [Vibrio gazogenes DSM 21264] [Vibrio gazogenes DSM 21264 = NBRC 103151]SJN52942.1 hypothetical protein BQ6471_00165 [Vibrio gazogenes]
MDDFSGLPEQDANQFDPDYVCRTQTLGILGYFFGREKVPGAQTSILRALIKPERPKLQFNILPFQSSAPKGMTRCVSL